MRRFAEVRERERIEMYLRRDLPLHLYEIGDLDPFFWPSTTWFALEGAGGHIEALVLRYAHRAGVTLLALDRDEGPALAELVQAIRERLPDRFHAHLRPGLAERLADSAVRAGDPDAPPAPRWTIESRTPSLKMFLADPKRARDVATAPVERFRASDLDALLAFYAEAYPGNWFDPRMIETGQYFGVRERGDIVAVAGVHVYSPEYRVAALGNIATRPSHRGRGLGTQVTAALCHSLLGTVDSIGLNVHADNAAAIRCYERLGFEPIARYEEVLFGPAR
jgi:ribosomal protein S18 acetylase RimI-like enzyme